MHRCVSTLLAVFFFFPVFLVSAQTPPCGNITAPAGWEDYFDPTETIQTTPIIDCEAPFGQLAGPNPVQTLVVEGSQVANNTSVIIPGAETGNYSIIPAPYDSNAYYDTILFKHTGTDFTYVSLEPLPVTEQDYRDVATEFFTNPADIEPNVARMLSDDPWAGLVYGTDEYNTIDSFYDYFQQHFVPHNPPLALGTYTLVFKFHQLYQTNLWHELLNQLIPAAYAQTVGDPSTYTLTFTLANAPTEPTGASSVLFLPGIQASRLYMGDGNQVSDRLWEPGNNTDVSLLSLSPEGTTNVDIRTNDIVDEAAIPYLGGNIYKGYMGFMDELVNDEVIKEWTPFAYDWRYDVFDIVENGTKYRDGSIRNPVDEVLRLAGSSFSKKVTIIAHSNGGLLAKAVMIELQERGKADLVDKIIFVGTPQLGTPKAIATLLHGYDQEALGGLIVDDGVARDVIRNLPGAYGLIPTETYFEESHEPVVYFDNSSTTQSMRTAYGTPITTFGAFNAFMVGSGDTTGRNSIAQSEVNKPILANSSMYFAAQDSHKLKLDSWTPPASATVFQVVGTGLPTMKAIEYREITETVCPLDAVSCLLCSKVKLLKPHGRFTPHGDETVVSESAAYMNGNHFSQYYFDLDKVENERIPIIGTKISHANLTETSQVQDFLSQIIKSGSSSDVEFFSVESPIFTKVYDIEEINSPVQISAKDSQGRVTGMVFENGEWLRKLEIPDTNYVEFGGTKYLITPATLERVTTLRGETLGGYTLTLSTFDGNGIQTKKHEVVDATSTPTMVALYSKTNGEFTTIKTDYNSDGVYEYENTIDGVYVAPPPLYTYSTLTGYINSLSIKKLYKDALLLIAREAERLHTKASGNNTYAKLEKVTLKFLESTVNLYNRQQILTKTQADEILKMITFLSK